MIRISRLLNWTVSLVLAAMVVGASVAGAEEEKPRLLIVPDRAEATLPGAGFSSQSNIVIRRGSGFPEPEPEPEVAEVPSVEEVEDPAPETRRIIIRRNRY